MEQRHFIIEKGRLKELPNHKDLGEKSSRRGQNWFDFQISDREELGEALENLIRTPSSWIWPSTRKILPT